MKLKKENMRMQKYLVRLLVFFVFFFSCGTVFAAEVYYLGAAAQGGPGKTGKNANFTLKKRVDDLCDLKSYGKYGPDRSGRITGTIMEEASWNDVGGNGTLSFLKKGVYQNTEVNINAQEKLWKDYNFDAQTFLRRTDDRRIEQRKDIRVKQLTTKLYNPDNMFMFGDFYGDFSQFTLGNSLEGFDLDIAQSGMCSIKGVAARSQSADPDKGTFLRYVAGGKTDLNLFKDSSLFSVFRVGAQAVTSQDDSSSVDNTNRSTRIQDLDNTVVSIDGEMRMRKYFSLFYEVARSAHAADIDTSPDDDLNYGTAFRMTPVINAGPLNFRYLYYYVQPQFYTDSGSAMPDKIQHQFTLNYAISKKASLSFVENYYWNHLEGSALSKRTFDDEKYFTLNMRPFDKYKDFNVRTYANVLQADSDDIENSAEATTVTAGFGINDMLDPKTSYGTYFEFRGFANEAEKANSDYFYRLGYNLGREQQVFGKRLYFSGDVNIDFHDPKYNPKNEVTTGCSFSGQYNFFKEHMFRFGYNIQTTNSYESSLDYLNNRTYAEFDLLMEKKHNTRCVLRGEHNRYNQNDRGLSYDESRIITRLATNF